MRLLLVTFVMLAAACAAPVACDRESCLGCCDLNGVCQGGDATQACGVGGNVCVACSAGRECQRGLCAKSAMDGG